MYWLNKGWMCGMESRTTREATLTIIEMDCEELKQLLKAALDGVSVYLVGIVHSRYGFITTYNRFHSTITY
jgi:hypothetical protein